MEETSSSNSVKYSHQVVLKTLNCTLCGDPLSSQEEMRLHMKEHSEGNDLSCNYCGEVFASPHMMRTHIQYQHHSNQMIGMSKKAKDNMILEVQYTENLPKMYQCKVCSLSFQYSFTLSAHMTSHKIDNSITQLNNLSDDEEEDSSHPCPKCPLKFVSSSALTEHMKDHSKNILIKNEYRTDEKPQKRLKTSDEDCFNGDTGIAFYCPECPLVFEYSIYLKQHLKTHIDRNNSKEKDAKFECQECHAVFKYEFSLKAHLTVHKKELHHDPEEDILNLENALVPCTAEQEEELKYLLQGIDGSSATDILNSFSYDNNKNDGEPVIVIKNVKEEPDDDYITQQKYSCQDCDDIFDSPSNLMIHLETHLTNEYIECLYCSQSFNTVSSMENHLIAHQNAFTCECWKCDKCFETTFIMLNHMNQHNEESVVKPHQCFICEKSYLHLLNLLVHLKMHALEKPHKCPYCHLGYNDLSNLESHIRTHTGDKRYKCEICGDGFDVFNSYLAHKKIHDYKPFKCDICYKTFGLLHHLKKHFETHRNDSNNSQFKCNICYKTFDEKTFTSHLESHAVDCVYPCSYCTWTFDCRTKLHKHEQDHLIIKSNNCYKCGKVFINQIELDKHMTIIHKLRCEICNIRISSYAGLNKHIDSHKRNGNTFECALCKLHFLKPLDYSLHIKENHSNATIYTNYECEFCGALTIRKINGRDNQQLISYECLVCLKIYNTIPMGLTQLPS